MRVASTTTLSTCSAREAVPRSREPKVEDVAQPTVSSRLKNIDFSRITPRQVQALCDELIFTGGKQGFEDASAIGNSLPSGIFERDPDTPIDLRGQMEGMVEFDRNNGFDALAAFYAGLLERMKLMEARSVHLSVVA